MEKFSAAYNILLLVLVAYCFLNMLRLRKEMAKIYNYLKKLELELISTNYAVSQIGYKRALLIIEELKSKEELSEKDKEFLELAEQLKRNFEMKYKTPN